MLTVRQDVTFALRTLRRRRAFSATAIITIALGIGAATAIYSVVDGVLFRPLPFREPGNLVAIWRTYPEWRTQPVLAYMWDRISFSIPEFREWRAAQTVYDDVGIWADRTRLLGRTDAPEMVRVTRVSPSLLDVLQVTPVLGRNFTAEEDVVGGAPVVMLSYEAWQARYQSDPNILGRAVRLDDQLHTIVGVLPRGLAVERGGNGSTPAPFWSPTGQDAQDADQRGNRSYRALGRLKPGVTLSQAITETDRILRGDATPDTRGVRIDEWQVDQTRTVRKPLLVLLGAAGMLLVISCVNVAVLLLGEASGREQEVAARMALGASRGRIITQLLTEALVLSGVGGVAGAGFAMLGTRALVALAPSRIPGLADVGIDLRVLAFTLAVATCTGILFGLAPALALARSSPSRVFRGAGGQSVAGRGHLQRLLVAAELALSLMLLVGAALLTRSLGKLTSVDPGFRADHLLSVRVTLPQTRYGDSPAVLEFHRSAVERLSSIPGVAAVTASTFSPFSGGGSSASLQFEGRAAGEQGSEAQQRSILPDYFQVMEIPVLSGRALTATDHTGNSPVMVVSRSMALRDFPGESPLGKQVRFHGQWWEVVGVVADTKYTTLGAEDQPTVYTSAAQRLGGRLTLLVRTSVEPTSVTPAVRSALREIDPGVPFAGAEAMTSLIRDSSAEERYRTILISLFGVIAGVLAAVGMYGVTARAVSRRTREIGIRVALGASPAGVTGLLVGYTLAGVAAGVAVGLPGALAGARLLEPFLFGVSTTDMVAYAGSVAFLALASVVASWLPARRASRVQPAVALKAE